MSTTKRAAPKKQPSASPKPITRTDRRGRRFVLVRWGSIVPVYYGEPLSYTEVDLADWYDVKIIRADKEPGSVLVQPLSDFAPREPFWASLRRLHVKWIADDLRERGLRD